MRVVTHDIFSLGLSVFLLSRTGHLSVLSMLIAFWLTLAVNDVIDVLGHTSKHGNLVRSLVTHSVFTAPLWGALVGVSTTIAPYSILDLPVNSAIVLVGAELGVGVGSSHLLLDSLTEAGVYLGRRRIVIAHLKYNNPPLNAVFIGMGLLLMSVAVAS